jgi:small conductance mechanosensitive channel
MERLTSLLGFEARYIVYPVAVAIAGLILRFILRRYLHRWAARTDNKFDDRIVAYLENILTPLLLLFILYWLVGFLPLSKNMLANAQKAFLLRQALLVTGILVMAYYTARMVSSLLVLMGDRKDNWQTILKPFRTLTNVVFVLPAVALSLKVLRIDLSSEGVRLVRIIGIIAGAFIISKIVSIAVTQFEHIVEGSNARIGAEAQKRARTVGKIISNAALVIIISVSVMMILSEFGMNIAPIITGAGIAGLAVGFGAQNLVRDVISGFFLILEDQIRVGDVAKINGVGGMIEAIRLRTTILRDAEGTVHTFPNGGITSVANMTKEYSYYMIDVGVAYKEKVDDVMKLLEQIGAELEKDPGFAPSLLAPLEIMGVDDFAQSQVTIKIRIKTMPLKQWMVGRELRRRIKNTFDSEHIEMPFPHLSVYLRDAKENSYEKLAQQKPE